MLTMMQNMSGATRAVTITAGAAGIAGVVLGATAGTAAAAPTSHADDVHALQVVDQTPIVGVSRSHMMVTGAFVAPVRAASAGPDTTVVWLEPMPGNACASSLRDAKVAVSWKNTRTHAADDATYTACRGGKPTVSPPLHTGTGRIQLTVSVVGQGGNSFTLSPGTATITR